MKSNKKISLIIASTIVCLALLAMGMRYMTQLLAQSEENSVVTTIVVDENGFLEEGVYETHESANDYTWEEADEVLILMDDKNTDAESKDVEIEDSQITITEGGVYRLQGSFSGQVVVDAEGEDVQLILDGVEIVSEDGPAIYVKDAEEAIIILAEESNNYVQDSADYSDDGEDAPNACIFSTADLSVYGQDGSYLTVIGDYKDGITSKDGLVISNAILNIAAVDDGIRGKDYLVVNSSAIEVNAGGDGLLADNDSDDSLGYIVLDNTTLDVVALGDGVSAVTDVVVNAAEVTVATSLDDKDSMKGLKAGVLMSITGTTMSIDSADDGLHSNDTITVSDSTITIRAEDDGMHADNEIVIDSGAIFIERSYEGIEASMITINDGVVDITSSDDGFNVSGGNDSSGITGRPGGQGAFAVLEGAYLTINGGTIHINAGGDGLDSNGDIIMTGGYVTVDGPINSANGAIDYNGDFEISGGVLVAIGSSGMAEAPGQSSSQNSLLLNFSANQTAGSVVTVYDAQGDLIVEMTAEKQFNSIVVSSPDLEIGEAYTVMVDGTSVGELTLDGVTTQSGSGGMMGGGMFDRGTMPGWMPGATQ